MKSERNVACKLLLAVIATSLALPVAAQTDGELVNSYHHALEILERALAAHGGQEEIQSAGGFVMTQKGSFDLTTRLQGRSPFRAEPTPISERIVYDAHARRVAYDVDWYNYHSSNQVLSEVYDNAGRVLFIDKRNRNGGWLPRQTVPDSLQRVTRHLPHMLLADALQQRRSLQFAGRKRRNGRSFDVIQYTTSAGQVLAIRVGAKSRLVLSAVGILDMPLLGDTELSWHWSDYATTHGSLQVPQRLEVKLGDKILKQAAVSFSLGSDAAAFEPPAEVSLDEPPQSPTPLSEFVPYGQRPPVVEALLPGVYMVNGLRPGFRVLFVEFNDFVLAVDAPTGWYEMNQLPPMNWSHGDSVAALAAKLQRAITKTVPDKPLRYVVLSHHHSDHIGGLRAFARDGVTFVAGEAAASVAQRALQVRSSIGGDDWQEQADTPDIQVVRGERVITDGSMEVRLIELPDGNPKADNYLMVYLPQQKLLYATAFIYPVPEAVFPLKESIPLSRYFVQWLDDSGLEVDLLYNVHGMGRVEEWQLEAIRKLPSETAASAEP